MAANVVKTGIGHHSYDLDFLPFRLGGDLNVLPNRIAIAEEPSRQAAAHDSHAWRTISIPPAEGPTLLQVDSDGLEETRHYERNPNATGANAFFARLGGIVWGGAADDHNLYYGLSRGGMVALQLATGEQLWYMPLAKPGTRVNNSAATSAMPGVAFVGGSDGKLHALNTADGKVVWEYDTAHAFDTVNKVPAKGGAISAIGPAVAGGMLFIGSGYAVTGSNSGNVLLAFAVE